MLVNSMTKWVKRDLSWLHSLDPYYEAAGFIAVHAGPELDRPWTDQAKDLDRLILPGERLIQEPAQIFGGRLGTVHDVPELVDSRTFVTGHLHLTLPVDQRIAKRKVCLASPLNRGAPLHVWRSDDQKIYSHS